MNTVRYIMIIAAVCCVSCNYNKANEGEANIVSGKKKSISIDEVIATRSGNYTNIHIPTDYIASIQSFQSGPLSEEAVNVNYSVYTDCKTKATGLPPVFDFFINNDYIASTNQTKILGEQIVSKVYGRDVAFRFKSNQTKSTETDTTLNIYIPKQLRITSPRVTNDKEYYPLCYYKNFILRWNADDKNTNGLIVSVEWLGTMLYGDEYTDTYVRRVDFIPEDNGETVLNEMLFKDIPDTGLVYITLLRGSIENVVVNDYSIKVGGESTTVLPIILIRNIKTN